MGGRMKEALPNSEYLPGLSDGCRITAHGLEPLLGARPLPQAVLTSRWHVLWARPLPQAVLTWSEGQRRTHPLPRAVLTCFRLFRQSARLAGRTR